MCKSLLLAMSITLAPLGLMHGATDTIQSDEKLHHDIQEKVHSGWFMKGYDQIKIAVRNGNVTLDGTVQTPDEKATVEKEIRNMDGVRSVTSNIKTLEGDDSVTASDHPQDTALTSADEQLNLKIRDQISGWIWDSYKGVSLNTSNGAVELKGEVADLKDQQKLMNSIQSVEGVKSVTSVMRVKSN